MDQDYIVSMVCEYHIINFKNEGGHSKINLAFTLTARIRSWKRWRILIYVIILWDAWDLLHLWYNVTLVFSSFQRKYWFKFSYKIHKNLRLEDSSSRLYILAVKESFFEDEHNFFCKNPCRSQLLISFNCMRIVGLVTI